MTDDTAVTEVAAPDESAAPTPEPGTVDEIVHAASASDEKSFDELLAEYDAANPAPVAQPEPPQPQPPTVQEILDHQRELNDLRFHGEQSARHIQALEQSLAEMRHQEWHRGEVSDFNKIVSKLNEDLAGDIPLPDKYVESWLFSRGMNDSVVRDAFDNRHTNPRHWDNVRTSLSRELHANCRQRVNPDMTEDRNAVLHYMRGASRSDAPHEPPQNLSILSDADLRRHTLEKYGFAAV
jgi:hypothetical protein